MNWSKNRSILLSQICIFLFAVVLAMVDIFAVSLSKWYIFRTYLTEGKEGVMILSLLIYSCSFFAWIALYHLWWLIKNLKREFVFENQNVTYLRRTSWCCIGVCLICLLGAVYSLPLILVSVASGFMGLIVRIVKNVFEQAISMKHELDFTV